MVDRARLINALNPVTRPTSSQAEIIRKSLEKALTDILLTLPLEAARQLDVKDKTELANFLSRLDSKSLEKLAKAWEPKRKLDIDLKKSLPIDLISLLEEKRDPYVPIKVSLDVARRDAVAVSAVLNHASARDLSSIFKSWDKHNIPVPAQRSAILRRLQALLGGEAPLPRTRA